MSKISYKTKATKYTLLAAMILLLAFTTFSYAQERQYSAKAWSFGVMGDTQWTKGFPFAIPGIMPQCDEQNANCVAVSVINQLNDEFIDKGVKFVVQLGDLSDWDGDAAMETRALAAQPLYDAGIGFFPMRGNHETYGWYFGLDPESTFSIPALQFYFPQTQGISNTFGAHNFSSPPAIPELNGVSYSFDYNNSRLVIIDPWETHDSSIPYPELHLNYGYPIGAQQSWISERLDKNKRRTEHAFVLAHQPLIAQNHADSPFGGYDDADIDGQNAFFANLQENDVKFYLSAHDHLYSRSVIASPNGKGEVEQLISSPACPKFYPAVDPASAIWAGQKYRQTPLSEEFNNIGYYIYTVDGPRVNVEYWADMTGNWSANDFVNADVLADGTVINSFTPDFTFVKKESWGYSLNGQEFLVAPGESFAVVQDRFRGTTAKILDGTLSAASDSTGRTLLKSINTGWTPKTTNNQELNSDILSLWGMSGIDQDEQTDMYVLSISHDFRNEVHNGTAGIAALKDGKWVNAVDLNMGASTKMFVYGPYKPEYFQLGTYGIDPISKSAWAVLDYNADFVVADGINPPQKNNAAGKKSK